MSSDDMKNKRSGDYRFIHNELDMDILSHSPSSLYNEIYDLYDINKRLLDERGRVNDRGESFFRSPIGYGQFISDGIPTEEGTEVDLWINANLIRNPNWCDFPEKTTKDIGVNKFIHEDFSTKNDSYSIEYSPDVNWSIGINNLGDNNILYNVPLSASLFNSDPLALVLASERRNKLKMQISHRLYGVFFGPAIENASEYLYIEARDFFSCFAERVRLENIVKYITGETQYAIFDDQIQFGLMNPNTGEHIESLLADLSIQKLYYPFYMGGQSENAESQTDISRYYLQLEEADTLSRQYKNMLGSRSLLEYYRGLNDTAKKDFYDNFINDVKFLPDVQKRMNDTFNNAREHMVRNNEVQIEIFYERDDPIGRTIALRYEKTLAYFFSRTGNSTGIQYKITPPTSIDTNTAWRTRAINNAKANKLSLLVKGWNYKFDMLDELRNQFIDDGAFESVEGRYKDMIAGTLGTEATFHKIAQDFVNFNIMIPLVGVQNYALYNKGSFPAFDRNKGIEMLMLPYYW
jgi:hypothetical protein